MWEFFENVFATIMDLCFIIIAIPLAIAVFIICGIIALPMWLFMWVFNIDGMRKGLI